MHSTVGVLDGTEDGAADGSLGSLQKLTSSAKV